jgi:protein-disulfide isomerase
MPDEQSAVSPGKGVVYVRALPLLIVVLLTISVATASATADPQIEQAVREHVGDCPAAISIDVKAAELKFPTGISGFRADVTSTSPFCTGSYLVMRSREHIFVGNPWPLSDLKGTPEEKIRAFGWERLGESFEGKIDRSKSTAGFLPAEIIHTTSAGKVTMNGIIDSNATLLLLGAFRPVNGDAAAHRLERLAPVIAKSPSTGNSMAKVHLVEFSDFQCPSCRQSSDFMKPILEKFGSRIRYTRVDFPLISSHPWSFSAAVMARAIHRQSPEAYWTFKNAVYSNQAQMNVFLLEDFARSFVEDNSLDLQRFQKDVESEAVQREILDAVGAGFSSGISGTPSFLVNGKRVIADRDGSNLVRHLERLLD